MDGDNEVKRQQWHPNVVRMRMVSLLDAQLEQITRDDSRRQVERDVARAILADRTAYSASLTAETESLVATAQEEEKAVTERAEALQRQSAEREAAHKNTGGDEPMAGDGSDWRSANHQAAEAFAKILNAAGLKCRPMRTQAIANRGQVKDGWVVNYHDQDTEIGFVATWWGRNHFQAFVEIAGHSDRTAEAADIFAAIFRRAEGPGI